LNRPKRRLRQLLFAYLVYEHIRLKEAAKRLGISERMASYHVSVMEKEGAITKKGDTISAIWELGPTHTLYTIPQNQSVTVMPYGMVQIDQTVTIDHDNTSQRYIDRAWFSVELIKQAPKDLKWWDKEWSSSGTMFKAKAFFLDHKRKITLTTFNDKSGRIQIEPFYIPAEIAHKAPGVAYDLAQRSLKDLAHATGMGFGLLLPYEGKQALTVEKETPLLKGIKPGVVPIQGTETYIDGTPPPGAIASTNMEYVKADAQMPYRLLNLEKAIVGIKTDIDEVKTTLSKLVTIFEKLVGKITEKDETPVKLLDDQDKGAYR